MRILLVTIYLWLLASCGAHPLFAQSGNSYSTGKKAADKYFIKRKERAENSSTGEPRSPRKSPAESRSASKGPSSPRYLDIHAGFFTDEETYKWGKKNNDDVGNFFVGVTYRLGEWTNSMDLSLRADFVSFEVDDKKPVKLSIQPTITFPDAKSGFPLYFGAGAGLGVYFKQAKDESSLSFDYQLVAGARFFNLIGDSGFLFELGLKNQLLLLSDGQHNGVYGALGGVFTF